MAPAPHLPSRLLGRYLLHEHFAAGGMATVHYGRLLGPSGFSRAVAIKRLHSHLASDPEFVRMFLDEARLVARIQHPNIVQTLDVASSDGELFVVLEYVHGHSLVHLLREAPSRGAPATPALLATIVFAVLEGLHAAHETRDEKGVLLEVVHRDVSPQNVMLGTDGISRVLDFGVAKARGRSQTTQQGQLKGKLSYMAPEQLRGQATRQTDVFAVSVVLWEALTGRRLFAGVDEGEIVGKVLHGHVPSPREISPEVTPELAAVVMRGLERDPAKRFATAREMALELQKNAVLATPIEVGAWVEKVGGAELSIRAARVSAIEAECSALVGGERVPGAPRSAVAEQQVPAGAEGSGATARLDQDHRGGRDDGSGAASRTASGAASTELATIPDQRPSSPTPLPGRRVVFGAAAVAFGLVLALRTGAHATPELPATAALPPVPETTTTTTTPAANELAADPPAAVSSASPAPAVFASAPSRVPPPSRQAAGASARKHTDRPARPECSTPYTIDERGMRHYKPECI